MASARTSAGRPELGEEIHGVDAVTRVFAGGAKAARLTLVAVSYTHLDVYKRQMKHSATGHLAARATRRKRSCLRRRHDLIISVHRASLRV